MNRKRFASALSAAAVALVAGLAAPGAAQTWVNETPVEIPSYGPPVTSREYLGTLFVDRHEVRFSRYGNFLAQLADAFRCAGYSAVVDCGRLRVDISCGLPRIRWTGCEDRLVIDREGDCLVITPIRNRIDLYEPLPTFPAPRIDIRIGGRIGDWDNRRDDRDHRDWDDRRDDRDHRDWDDRRDDRDHRDWDDRRDDRDHRDWDDRRDDRDHRDRDDRGDDRRDGRDHRDDRDGRDVGDGGHGRAGDNGGGGYGRTGDTGGGSHGRSGGIGGGKGRLPDWQPRAGGNDGGAPQGRERLGWEPDRRGEQTGSRPENKSQFSPGGRSITGGRGGRQQSSIDGFDVNLNAQTDHAMAMGFGAEQSGIENAGFQTAEFQNAGFQTAAFEPARDSYSGFQADSSGWVEAGWNDRGGRDRNGGGRDRGGWDRGGGDRGGWDRGGWDRGHDWNRGRDWGHDSWRGSSRGSVSFSYGWNVPSYPVYSTGNCFPTYNWTPSYSYCAPRTYYRQTYCAPSYSFSYNNYCGPTFGYSINFGGGWGCR